MPTPERTVPIRRRGKGLCGGGPANEQNYTTGLMLHHFLTGSPASREAALELARWVIDVDDGTKTVFRWLARGYTGRASQSQNSGFDYHGPGRGAANSIAALLDGHRLSGDAAFLAKAEQLIRRCIHPADDVPARNLLDAENRWFYTMFLQSLGRYLDYKAEQTNMTIASTPTPRACLLHYARWMATNEYPYLEKPEILEYPTETWAAQDMRKSEIFKYAAKHSTGAGRARFLERSEFLRRMRSRSCPACRHARLPGRWCCCCRTATCTLTSRRIRMNRLPHRRRLRISASRREIRAVEGGAECCASSSSPRQGPSSSG